MENQQSELLDKVTELFWEKGFQATSMRDVQQTLDMRPGSLYARFPGKSALFIQVIDHYASQLHSRLANVAEAADLIAATRSFFIEELLRPPCKRYQRQCLLINAIAESSKLDSDTASALDKALRRIEDGFTCLVEALQVKHCICSDVNPGIIATWLQTQFIGLRHSAYRTMNDACIAYYIDKLLTDLQGAWPIIPETSSSAAESPD